MAEGSADREASRRLEAAAIMATIWALTLFAGTIPPARCDGRSLHLGVVFTEVASALANVGLTTGVTDPGLPWFGKLGLIIIMWLGRLEIVPVLVVIAALMVSLHPRRQRGAFQRGPLTQIKRCMGMTP